VGNSGEPWRRRIAAAVAGHFGGVASASDPPLLPRSRRRESLRREEPLGGVPCGLAVKASGVLRCCQVGLPG
jgi:hypothetical protein